MSKKIKLIIEIMLVAIVFCSACSKAKTADSPVQKKAPTAVAVTKEPKENETLTNLNWTNPEGVGGDADGPAWVLYSKTGYNQASVNIGLKDVRCNLVRKSDGLEVASYLFLGVDVYNNGEWINCVDAGLCRVGNGKWHGVINRYQPETEKWYSDYPWWESSVNLNEEHDYKLLLQTSGQAGKVTLNIIDLTDENKLADSKTVDLKYAQNDGSNTRFYRDLAIDFPPEVCKDKQGNSTDDWIKVMEYNTNEDLYVRNVHCSDTRLYNQQGSYPWTDALSDCRFLWPESTDKLSYECTKVSQIKRDYEDVTDLDMNTK